MTILYFFSIFTGLILRPTLPVIETPPPISIVGFHIDSDATRIANYRYKESSGDLDMIATFLCENGGMNIKSVSPGHDHGLCQLQYNRTNKVWIDDSQRLSGRQYQAQVCLDKWNAVSKKTLRSCYNKRKPFINKIHINGTERDERL